MRIAYCIAATYNSGGMERMLSLKANELVERGHEVCVITTDQRNQKPFFNFNPSIRHFDLNINYEENNGKSIFNKILHYPGKQRRHRKALSALLSRLKPDVTVSMFCNEASILHNIKSGGAKILEIHFSRFKRLQYGRKGIWGIIDRLRNNNDKRIAAKYNRFAVLTEEDAALWGKLPNMTVIPNFCKTLENPALADMSAKRVIAVGRISYQKGFDRLLQAWALVIKKFPDWKLTVFGGGDKAEKDNLLKLADSFGIAGSFELLPPVKDIQKEYAKSSILAMTSRYEGLPMVLVEAQQQGLPIVSFDCKCGPKDVILPGRNGLLVKEGDVEGFAQALEKLMSDTDLRNRMQRESLENIKRFDKNLIMDKWESLFREVAG